MILDVTKALFYGTVDFLGSVQVPSLGFSFLELYIGIILSGLALKIISFLFISPGESLIHQKLVGSMRSKIKISDERKGDTH